MESLIIKFTDKYICFTVYLKSGGLKQWTVTQGGVLEKRSRTTEIKQASVRRVFPSNNLRWRCNQSALNGRSVDKDVPTTGSIRDPQVAGSGPAVADATSPSSGEWVGASGSWDSKSSWSANSSPVSRYKGLRKGGSFEGVCAGVARELRTTQETEDVACKCDKPTASMRFCEIIFLMDSGTWGKTFLRSPNLQTAHTRSVEPEIQF